MVTENPKPWSTEREMPGCANKVKQTITMRWSGVWQPEHHITVNCEAGKRKVGYLPNFYYKKDLSFGCTGCPAYTPPTTEPIDVEV